MSSSSAASEELSSAEASRWFKAEVLPHEAVLRRWLRLRFPWLRDRDDIVQETYLRMIRAHSDGPIHSVKAFLFTTARNLALNRLRHLRHEHPEFLGQIDPSSVLDESADTPEAIARAQELGLLTEAIQSLPERCRQVFTLRRIYGLSQKAVAAQLGISEKTVEAQSVIAMRKCVRFFRHAEGSKSSPAETAPALFNPRRPEGSHV